MEAGDRPRQLKANATRGEVAEGRMADPRLQSQQSCKTLKLVAKQIGQTQNTNLFGDRKEGKEERLKTTRKESAGSDHTEDKKSPIATFEGSQQGLSEKFYQSDTYRCFLKEKETISFVKRVRKDIECELIQRAQAVNDLKLKLQVLIDKERHLMMAIDGQEVQNDLDLNNLQYF